MKIYTLCLFLFLGVSGSFAQVGQLHPMGSKTLYRAQASNYAAVPKGYQPVYVNYIGRHGARHLTKAVNLSVAYQLIAKADSANALSAKGKDLKLKLSNLIKEEGSRVASISKSGEEELKGIATRMFKHQKNVFAAKQPEFLVATTKKGRTKESSEAFIAGLGAVHPDLIKNIKYNYADDDHLRFYDFSETYTRFKEEGNWNVAYQKLAGTANLAGMAAKFTANFFTPAFLNKMNAAQKTDFLEDVYGFYTILPAVEFERKQAGLTESDLNFKGYFTNAELNTLAMLGDAEDFLKKGPGMHADGIQVRIAAPLLADFINTTDAYLKNNGLSANLRFAHAETIAPFAAIMGIKGASEPAQDIKKFEQVWKAEQVIPFSANIQWVVYKNEANQYLIKFLLNEKEVAINGLSSKTYPYYDWQAVRAFYIKKLNSYHLGLQDDAHQYLLKVK